MAKKWGKATMEIIIAVVLIILLSMLLREISTHAPAEVRNSVTAAFITWLFIFVIIWCFVVAAVNIVASIIGRAGKLSVTNLEERIEALDRRISAGQSAQAAGVTSGGPPGSYEPAPPPPDDMKKASKKIKLAVIAVIVILVIAGLAIGLVLFAFSSPPAGGTTPDQAFNTFIDRMNAKDANGAIGQTVWTFSPDRGKYVDGFDQNISNGTFHVTVVSHQIIQKQALNATARAEMDKQRDDLQQQLNISISDYVVIDFTVTVQTDQGTMNQSQMMECVQVDDKWYLVFEFSEQGPSGPAGSSPIEVSLSKANMTGNWTVGVTNVANASTPLPTSGVFIEVRYAINGTVALSMQLSSMTGGTYYNGTQFNDMNNIGQLDSGDNFKLDSSMYFDGTELKLTDSGGTVVYADVIL